MPMIVQAYLILGALFYYLALMALSYDKSDDYPYLRQPGFHVLLVVVGLLWLPYLVLGVLRKRNPALYKRLLNAAVDALFHLLDPFIPVYYKDYP